MIDLLNTTFIVPLQIEHQDRYNNAEAVLKYLNKHLLTNIYIYEVGEKSSLDFLTSLTNLQISTILDKPGGVFHRMQYLNILLNEVETPVVVNYDIDVLLPIESYVEAQKRIIEGSADLVYPYTWGQYQRCIEKSLDRDKFLVDLDITSIDSAHLRSAGSEYGHCIFFNTDIYRVNGGENENFISWGPEDKERGHRFRTLGYRVEWLPESYVYHFEHTRTSNSSKKNPFINQNNDLYLELLTLTEEQLREYYTNQDYIKKYDNFLHTK